MPARPHCTRLSRLIASAVAANVVALLMAQIAAACTNGNGFPH